MIDATNPQGQSNSTAYPTKTIDFSQVKVNVAKCILLPHSKDPAKTGDEPLVAPTLENVKDFVSQEESVIGPLTIERKNKNGDIEKDKRLLRRVANAARKTNNYEEVTDSLIYNEDGSYVDMRKLAKTNELRYRTIKAAFLPFVLWSGDFNKRDQHTLVAPSGLEVLDIDHLDPSEIEWAKRQLFNDPFLNAVMVFESGKGVKVVSAVPYTLPDEVETKEEIKAVHQAHKQWWSEVEDYLLNQPNDLQLDKSGKDFARACFLFDDPDVLYRPQLEVEQRPLPEVEPAAQPAQPVGGLSTSTYETTTLEDIKTTKGESDPEQAKYEMLLLAYTVYYLNEADIKTSAGTRIDLTHGMPCHIKGGRMAGEQRWTYMLWALMEKFDPELAYNLALLLSKDYPNFTYKEFCEKFETSLKRDLTERPEEPISYKTLFKLAIDFELHYGFPLGVKYEIGDDNMMHSHCRDQAKIYIKENFSEYAPPEELISFKDKSEKDDNPITGPANKETPTGNSKPPSSNGVDNSKAPNKKESAKKKGPSKEEIDSQKVIAMRVETLLSETNLPSYFSREYLESDKMPPVIKRVMKDKKFKTLGDASLTHLFMSFLSSSSPYFPHHKAEWDEFEDDVRTNINFMLVGEKSSNKGVIMVNEHLGIVSDYVSNRIAELARDQNMKNHVVPDVLTGPDTSSALIKQDMQETLGVHHKIIPEVSDLLEIGQSEYGKYFGIFKSGFQNDPIGKKIKDDNDSNNSTKANSKKSHVGGTMSGTFDAWADFSAKHKSGGGSSRFFKSTTETVTKYKKSPPYNPTDKKQNYNIMEAYAELAKQFFPLEQILKAYELRNKNKIQMSKEDKKAKDLKAAVVDESKESSPQPEKSIIPQRVFLIPQVSRELLDDTLDEMFNKYYDNDILRGKVIIIKAAELLTSLRAGAVDWDEFENNPFKKLEGDELDKALGKNRLFEGYYTIDERDMETCVEAFKMSYNHTRAIDSAQTNDISEYQKFPQIPASQRDFFMHLWRQSQEGKEEWEHQELLNAMEAVGKSPSTFVNKWKKKLEVVGVLIRVNPAHDEDGKTIKGVYQIDFDALSTKK